MIAEGKTVSGECESSGCVGVAALGVLVSGEEAKGKILADRRLVGMVIEGSGACTL